MECRKNKNDRKEMERVTTNRDEWNGMKQGNSTAKLTTNSKYVHPFAFVFESIKIVVFVFVGALLNSIQKPYRCILHWNIYFHIFISHSKFDFADFSMPSFQLNRNK